MKRCAFFLIAFVLLITVPGATSRPKPVVAFGLLTNETPGGGYAFIETVFPNAFARAIADRYDVEVIFPSQTNELLKQKKQVLKKSWAYFELPELVETLKAQVFIDGSYEVRDAKTFRISINIFAKGSNEVFTFTNVGKMESDVRRLVERVSAIIMEFFEKDSYRKSDIVPGKRIGILTNLNNVELNCLYAAFLEKDYPVIALQGNHLKTYIGNESIEKFKYLRTGRSSYTSITDWRKIKLVTGHWANKRYGDGLELVKRIYRIYDIGYADMKDGALSRLRDAFSEKIDYLMVIGFNGNRTSAWMRCIDLKEKDLVWIKDDYRPGGGDPLVSLSRKIVDSLTQPVSNPFVPGGAGTADSVRKEY